MAALGGVDRADDGAPHRRLARQDPRPERRPGVRPRRPCLVLVVSAAPERPLAGVRVLDLSRAIAGPYPARILSDLGADVVKAEPPEGDITDLFGKQQAGRSGLFAQMNAGKRNLLLDLGAPADAALARQLAAVAD